MITLRRVAEEPDAVLELVAAGIARQGRSPWCATSPPDAVAAARLAMRRYLEADPLASGWVAMEDGRAVAVLGATLEVVDEDHVGYTYMHPRHASTPLSAWTATTWQHAAAHLPALVRAVAADARPHGITRLLVQTRPHDWVAGAFWRELGMWPDVVLAGLTLPAPGRRPPRHRVRSATEADEGALLRLAFDEYEYHARHTRTGTIADQAEAPTRRELAQARAEQAEGRGETLVVDGPDGRPIGSLRTMVLDLPDASPGRAYLPARYGYVALTSVVPDARGAGVGTSLVDAALAWFADRGLDSVLLHYVDDNVLSRPFWSRRGFAPLVVTLAGDILR